MNTSIQLRTLINCVICFAVFFAFSMQNQAASYTLDWDAGGASAQWSDNNNWNPNTTLTSADNVTLTFDLNFSANNSTLSSALVGIDVAGLTFGAAAIGNLSAQVAGNSFDLVGNIINNSVDTVTGASLGGNLTITTDSTLRTITNNGTLFTVQSDVIVGSGGVSFINAASALQSGNVGIQLGSTSSITGSGSVSFTSNDIDNGLNLNSFITVLADLDMNAGAGNNALNISSVAGSSVRLLGSTSNSYTGVTEVSGSGILYIEEASSLGAIGAGNHTNVGLNANITFRGTGTSSTYTVAEDFFITGTSGRIDTGDTTTNVTFTGLFTISASTGVIGAGAAGNTVTFDVASGNAVSHGANALTIVSGGAGANVFIQDTISGTSGNVTFNSAGTVHLNADLTTTGATDVRGNVTVNTTSAIDNVIASGNLQALFGTINLNSNNTIAGITQGNGTVGGSISDINIATGKILTMGGNYIYNERTDDSSNTVATIDGGTLALGGATRTFTIDDDQELVGAETTITSVISGSNGITKAGNGILALSAVNTYSAGNTRVNAGVLDNNGTIANAVLVSGGLFNNDGNVNNSVTINTSGGAFIANAGSTVTGNTIVNSGGFLSGVGTLGDAATDTVTINNGGSLNPGLSSTTYGADTTTGFSTLVSNSGNQIGTLTINADLTTTGTGVINIQLQGGSNSSDLITGIDALTLVNSSVKVSGSSFIDGNSYDMFNFATISASLAALDLSGTG
jgi:autotransporter-associated beta strand protein